MSTRRRLALRHPESGELVELPRSGSLGVGSSAERAGFVVAGAEVADLHCAIGRLKGGGWAVRDLGSRGGTRVNGEGISSARLRPGDVLHVGSVRLEVVDPAEVPDAPPAEASSGAAGHPPTVPDPQARVADEAGAVGNGAQAEEPVETRIGGFRIEGPLGRGSMGQVFLAVQESLDRRVALKVLAPRYAGNAEFLRRFQLEARAAAALSHPNVVVVYDVGEAGGRHYLSMELMEGGNLEERLAAGGPLAWRDALPVLTDAALGLVFAEAQGILHRDIKPANLMQNAAGVTKLADLGLAVRHDEEDVGERIFGTPHFMAPEQVRGDSVDHRADLYAFGATAFRLVTGHTPFEGDSTREILRAKLTGEAPPLRQFVTGVPVDFERVVARLLRRNPSERYGSARELVADLEALRIAQHSGSSVGRWATAAVVLAAVGTAAWFGLAGGAPESPGPQTELARAGDPGLPELPDDGDTTAASPSDDDEALKVFELEAQIALRDVPHDAATDPDGRREALLALAQRFDGTNAAATARSEAASIASRLDRAATTAAARQGALQRAEAELRKLARLEEPRATGTPTLEPVAALAALSSHEASPELSATDDYQALLQRLRADVLARARTRVRAGLAAADEAAAAGDFDAYRRHLGELARIVDTTSLSDAARASAAAELEELGTLAVEITQRSNGAEALAQRWRADRMRADEERIARGLVGPNAVEGAMRRGELAAAATTLEALASELNFERPRARMAALRTDLTRGQAAFGTLVDEFAKGEWRRKTVVDPRDGGGGGSQAVGADAEALTLVVDGRPERIAWGQFLGSAEEVDRLFHARLQRDYTGEERAGIAALARMAVALESVDLIARRAADRAANAPDGELQAELDAILEPARRWVDDTPYSEALNREHTAAGIVARALDDRMRGAWPSAVAELEHALEHYGDTLVVALLSDGGEWRPADSEIVAGDAPATPVGTDGDEGS